MMTFGLTPDGFNTKRLDDIKTELENDYRSIFGENIVLTPQSPQGQEIGVWSNTLSLLWEQLENSYNSFNPAAAVGVQLSLLVLLNGLTRKAATKTVVIATLTGTNGTLIPAGSLAATTSGSVFESIADVTIPMSGTIDIDFRAQEFGEIPAATGTLTIIETPIGGWATINNAADGVLGRDEETDAELRSRRAESTALPASNIIDALYAALFALDGVNDVVIYVNNTNVTDVNNVPPHRFAPIVDGGDNTEIAQAIYINHTAGDKSFGDVTEIITNSRGLPVDVSFSRPIDVNIWVIVNLTTNADFPQNGDELMKQVIVDYANGEFEADECDRGFKIAEDVIFSRLFTPINSICGHQVDSLFIGTAPSPTGTVNIPIAFNEASRFDVSRITVNI
jgi:uncharacterized phage protein gp47/JayE